ncbi:hypothetical protein J6590_069654 [Homalodisca vitripennis]|nr:hypothetical protein J6590_069654 [Homalodisca vitripennis]
MRKEEVIYPILLSPPQTKSFSHPHFPLGGTVYDKDCVVKGSLIFSMLILTIGGSSVSPCCVKYGALFFESDGKQSKPFNEEIALLSATLEAEQLQTTKTEDKMENSSTRRKCLTWILKKKIPHEEAKKKALKPLPPDKRTKRLHEKKPPQNPTRLQRRLRLLRGLTPSGLPDPETALGEPSGNQQ